MKNIKKVFVISLSSLLLLSGCWKRTQSLYVVNVLDKSLYDECHIEGSINVPYVDVKKWAESIDKKAEVVFYCSNYACTASEFAAKQLMKMGFSSVWAYEAGMHDWHAKGYPEVCIVESSYLKQDNPETSMGSTDIPWLTTEQLYQKMIEHGILKQS